MSNSSSSEGNWFHRDAIKILSRAVRHFPVVLLTGPRQSGKTSLLRRFYPKHAYISLDVPSLAAQAEDNAELFLEGIGSPVIIDEVQYAPSLFRAIKPVVDRRRKPGTFLLTGSQTFPLMQGVSESLSGRCAILNLQSLSAAEIGRRRKPSEFEMLLTGGFPELWKRHALPRDLWFSSYLATYLERDIRNILKVANLRDFERFLRAASARTGQLLNYADMARDVGIAVSTARAWTSVLQASGQVLLLEPYHRNLGKRLVKTPKLYFLDVGLAAFLNGIGSRSQLLASPLLGAMWETFVVGEVYRSGLSSGVTPRLWFWQNRLGHEVDIVMDEGGRYRLVEMKFAERIGESDLRGIRSFQEMYGAKNVASAVVYCRTPHRHTVVPKITARHPILHGVK